jgi:hypothetical protein
MENFGGMDNSRWERNIKMNITEVSWGCELYWFGSGEIFVNKNWTFGFYERREFFDQLN